MTSLPALRAPTADGALLAVPPLDEAGALLTSNLRARTHFDRPLLDTSWPEVRLLARRELLAAAARYTQPTASPSRDLDRPLLLAGHQPELFHPGVWLKNFALAVLARRLNATSVNLIIDSDTVKSTAVMLPMRGSPWPRLQPVLFDRPAGEIPWEVYRLQEPDLFASFPDRILTPLAEWGIHPLLPQFWRTVEAELTRRDGIVGESFAAARRSVEMAWGCRNLEVPLSHLCQGQAFPYLVGAILADLPRFVACYNGIVQEHRRRRRIRSTHHPVPDLAIRGDWLELPLWGWSETRRRRGRLFARSAGACIELQADNELWPALPSPVTAPEAFRAAWQQLEPAGFKARSRALLTTTFARTLLGDLFLHGIGGGKYDELTDALLARFWEVPPPAFMVVSATCLLPLPTFSATASDCDRLARTLRDLHYNPQRHLSATEGAPGPLQHQKEAWIHRTPDSPTERRERFSRLRHFSDQLRPFVAEQITQTRQLLEETTREVAANAVLRRRDYAFCLFPEARLRPFLSRVLGTKSGREESLDSSRASE
ncbi:MAG: hypothetical protein U0840_29415 [Gemmataceae bacterium]